MRTRPKNSEAQTLEQYRVAFENTASQTQISTTMVKFGCRQQGTTTAQPGACVPYEVFTQ